MTSSRFNLGPNSKILNLFLLQFFERSGFQNHGISNPTILLCSKIRPVPAFWLKFRHSEQKMNFWAKWKLCFHWVASFGFDGVDVRKENLFKKKKKKKEKKKRSHLWHLGGLERKFLGRYFLYNAITCLFIHKTAITSFYKNISFK